MSHVNLANPSCIALYLNEERQLKRSERQVVQEQPQIITFTVYIYRKTACAKRLPPQESFILTDIVIAVIVYNE